MSVENQKLVQMLQSITNTTFSLSPLTFLHKKPTNLYPSVSSPSSSLSYYNPKTRPVKQWLAEALEESSTTKTIAITEQDDGPVELPPSSNSIFATDDDPTPLQVATSVLLTGAITIFLFRSVRRRAKRAKEMRFRSSGVKETKKSLQEEALDTLKAMKPGAMEPNKPPSAIQALLGAISAGVIALILYKFTTTIEASLNRQTFSDNLSARQITITVRTIINGVCYLATSVFGINSVGLLLYSGQLAINSIMKEFSSDGATTSEAEDKLSSPESPAESLVDTNAKD